MSTLQTTLTGEYPPRSSLRICRIRVLTVLPAEYENNCDIAGAKVSFLTLTFPNGSSGAPTATGASPVTAPATTNNPSVNSNPLARNDAGIVGVSVASVASAVGIVVAALL